MSGVFLLSTKCLTINQICHEPDEKIELGYDQIATLKVRTIISSRLGLTFSAYQCCCRLSTGSDTRWTWVDCFSPGSEKYVRKRRTQSIQGLHELEKLWMFVSWLIVSVASLRQFLNWNTLDRLWLLHNIPQAAVLKRCTNLVITIYDVHEFYDWIYDEFIWESALCIKKHILIPFYSFFGGPASNQQSSGYWFTSLPSMEHLLYVGFHELPSFCDVGVFCAVTGWRRWTAGAGAVRRGICDFILAVRRLCRITVIGALCCWRNGFWELLVLKRIHMDACERLGWEKVRRVDIKLHCSCCAGEGFEV